ncbi:Cupin domain protein [Nocardioides dokdonensis FR1436]|uniref:Cupin domain protein n=1 Tax=Nocardioides dokdonensis FR1436 TaxID=1300347 RepID=A0A1A9GLM6_9ACTN|nr:cupin domain-containing protein [Nocardioides dokdonensis]ANH39227.1 Cupin domain protein [Nocardioides dokdonensis FR1436]
MEAQAPVVIGPEDGDISPEGRVKDRFLLEGHTTGGRFALVEHRFEPHALAAPMHLHHQEDEYTFVLRGRIGAVIGGQEVLAGPGDLVVKPRGQWHTFWNPGDEDARVLELISPGGFEQLFRQLMDHPVEDPEELGELAREYQCEIDLEATGELLERHTDDFWF